jgi:hypothetical protein
VESVLSEISVGLYVCVFCSELGGLGNVHINIFFASTEYCRFLPVIK